MLAAVSLTFLAYLKPLAVDRSITRASAEVAELQNRVQHAGGTTPAEQATRAALANAQERLAAGRSLDHSPTMTVQTLEMTFSAAPILAVELAVAGCYAWLNFPNSTWNARCLSTATTTCWPTAPPSPRPLCLLGLLGLLGLSRPLCLSRRPSRS